MTVPVPDWPGRMVELAPGERVWLTATTPAVPDAGRELVLCVHGMAGAATNWDLFMAELAPDFACAAVDLPGSGFSPPPKTRAGYSISALTNTVIRLVEALGAGSVHLVGNSMGAVVSIRVADRRPDLVRTLTLISPALPDLKVRKHVLHFPLLALPVVGERLVRQWAARYSVENRVAGVFTVCCYDPSRIHPDRLAYEAAELRRRDALSYNATVLADAGRAMVLETLRPGPFSLWRAVGRVTAPALVLFGRDDRMVSRRLALRAARTFTHAQVLVVLEAGHIMQLERPGLAASLFREMVEETRTRATGRDAGNSGRRDPVGA